MPKQISIKVLLTVVVAIIALFAVAEVGAQSGTYDYPSFSDGEYEVTAVDPFPEYILCSDTADGSGQVVCPCLDNPSGFCSKYALRVTDLVEPYSLSHFSILIPKNIVDKIASYACNGAPCATVEEKCDSSGDPSTGFGKFLQWYCTVKFSNSLLGDTAEFSLTAFGQLATSPTDFIIKWGSVEENWVSGIINGPFYDETIPIGASEGSECVTIDSGDYPISMSLTRDPVSGYALIPSIRFYRSVDCTPCLDCTPSDPPGGTPPEVSQPTDLVFCSGGARNINECIRLNADSPGCVDYYVGGTLCEFCW